MLSTRIAAHITHQLTQIRGTGRSITVQIDHDLFYQLASYGEDRVLIEISAEEFLPADRALPEGSRDELVRLGFNLPIPSMPNWWILIDGGQEKDLLAAATATTTALLWVFNVDVQELARAVGLPRIASKPAMAKPAIEKPQPRAVGGEGEPLVVDGSLGDLRLYPNGFATLDGQAWADYPVRDWAVNSEGRIGITLEPAGDKAFPHVGIVENTADAVAVLRRFTPSRDERRILAHRLAVAEYYPLTCIVTGTIYHFDLGRAVWDLEREHRDYPPRSIAGWPFAQRLRAATDAANYLYWTQSADNNHELRSDEQATWKAIQKWVRISPWRDDLDFEIKPSARVPYHIAPAPELEIQRVHRVNSLAESLATKVHAGQVDKAGAPYIDHPRRVAERVAEVDGRPEAIAVAWLHDVVEDTVTTLDDLRAAGFGEDIVAAVHAMTRRPDEGDAYYRRVAADNLARVVKLADVWDNTDPERVAQLSAEDRARLAEKYRHTLEVIADASTVEPWTLGLRDLKVNGIRSTLTVRREADGTAHFEAQDLGVPAGLVSNNTEYEHFRTIQPRHVPQLIELLGGRPGDDLRDLLDTQWADDRSFELEKRFREAPFPIEFFSS